MSYYKELSTTTNPGELLIKISRKQANLFILLTYKKKIHIQPHTPMFNHLKMDRLCR